VRTISLDLLDPLTAFGPRVTQVDARVSRIFRMGNRRVQANFDLYNIANASTVVGYNTTYTLTGTNRWLQPTQVLDARLAKVSLQVDF
jgi:hypothetical protein